jgi:hypothetical protein
VILRGASRYIREDAPDEIVAAIRAWSPAQSPRQLIAELSRGRSTRQSAERPGDDGAGEAAAECDPAR